MFSFILPESCISVQANIVKLETKQIMDTEDTFPVFMFASFSHIYYVMYSI